MRAPEVVSPPSVELLSLTEAKQAARVYLDLTDDDALITAYVTAARMFLENTRARAFVNQTLRETRIIPSDGYVRLLRAPVQSITSATINGTAVGDLSTLTRKGEASFYFGSPGSTAVITYLAGYGATAASVPETARLCVRFLVAYWYERREPIQAGTIVATLPFAYEALSSSLSWGGEVPPR